MYNDFNDYEQLYLISENDDFAKNVIFEKYKPIIVSIAKKYYSYMKGRYDIDDFIQEGYIGLNRAIDSFEESKDVLFYTFCILCIERQVQSYFRKINTLKNFHFNNSCSLDAPIEDVSFTSIIPDESDRNDPFTNSSIELLCNKLIVFKNDLDINHSCVFELRYNGFKYREISNLLDIPVSIVDNYIHFCKCKLNKYLFNYK